jgi:hypothetical protein
MKALFETDYVIYDKALDNPLQDPDGRILIFGNPDDAFDDLFESEIAIPCTELPIHWQQELIKQINQD